MIFGGFFLLNFSQAEENGLQSPNSRGEVIQELADAISENHADPFHKFSQENFEKTVQNLKATSGEMSEAEFITAITKLSAALGDGHTFINWTGVKALPLRLNIFTDGIFVTDALPDYQNLVGGRIEKIGNFDIKTAIEKISPLVSADNEFQKRLRTPIYLSIFEFLEGVGLANPNSVVLEIKLKDGIIIKQSIKGVSFEEHLKGLNIIPASIQQYLVADFDNALSFGDMRPQTESGPLYRRQHANSYWFEKLPEQKALYINYRYVRQGNPPMSEFAKELGEISKANPNWKVIVDIRENPGGSSELSYPLAEMLQKIDSERKPGWLFIIISPKTFSAATGFLSRLELRTSAILVGSEAGAGANHFGNVKTIQIESLGEGLKYSSFFNAWGLPEDSRNTTPPHVEKMESSTDFFSGNDIVLSRVLELNEKDFQWVESKNIRDLSYFYGFAPGQVLHLYCNPNGCRISITGILSTLAKPSSPDSFLGWFRGLALERVSEKTVQYKVDGFSRILEQISYEDLPFEEFIFQGNYEIAKTRLKAEFENDAGSDRFSPSKLNGLGYELYNRGEIIGAIKVLESAVAIHPTNANLYDSMGEFQVALGDNKNAQKSYEKALEIDPGLKSSQNALQDLKNGGHTP